MESGRDEHQIQYGVPDFKQMRIASPDLIINMPEIINNVFEYAPSKLIVHILPASLLIVQNTKVIRRIVDPNHNNCEKN